jgi:hypothetical protein
MTPESIAKAVAAELRENRVIGEDVHRIHHAYTQAQMDSGHFEFVKMLVEREQRIVERKKKFSGSFIGGVALAIVGLLSWLGTVIFSDAVTAWLKSHIRF